MRTSSIRLGSGLRFIWISSAGGRDQAEVQNALVAALGRIARARGGFGELVNSHLGFVAALAAPKPAVLPNVRGYVTPFTDLEASSEHYLACRLIWAATYVRLSRDAFGRGAVRDIEAIRSAAYEAQLRFTRQFEDAEEWVQYLEQHPSGI